MFFYYCYWIRENLELGDEKLILRKKHHIIKNSGVGWPLKKSEILPNNFYLIIGLIVVNKKMFYSFSSSRVPMINYKYR